MIGLHLVVQIGEQQRNANRCWNNDPKNRTLGGGVICFVLSHVGWFKILACQM
jgi:hypothetical protein